MLVPGPAVAASVVVAAAAAAVMTAVLRGCQSQSGMLLLLLPHAGQEVAAAERRGQPVASPPFVLTLKQEGDGDRKREKDQRVDRGLAAGCKAAAQGSCQFSGVVMCLIHLHCIVCLPCLSVCICLLLECAVRLAPCVCNRQPVGQSP